MDRTKGNIDGMYTSPVTNIEYPSYQEYLFSSKELGDAAREEGSGYNAILTTDITKKGESMFNSPRVTFLKGNALGDTAQEVIDKKEFKETKFKIPTKPVAPADLNRIAAIESELSKLNERYWAVDSSVAERKIQEEIKKLEAELAALKSPAAPATKKKKFKRGTKSRDIVDKLGCPKKK